MRNPFTTPTITICSDASYAKFAKRGIGAWACYIRTPNHTVKTSGLIKSDVRSASDAERLGVANALFIADRLEDLSKFRVIVYCDNLKALQWQYHIKTTPKYKEKYDFQVAEKAWADTHLKPIIKKCLKYETRHVKGHLPQDKWHAISKRNYMNDWCDKEAKRVMRAEKHIRQQEHEKKLTPII